MLRLALICQLVVCFACVADESIEDNLDINDDTQTDDPDPTGDPNPEPEPEPCFTPDFEVGDWKRSIASPITTALGSAQHGAVDGVAAIGGTAEAVARFAYGPTAKDLEGENVLLWVERADCVWVDLGITVTDDEGQATVEVPADILSAAGTHRFRFTVIGDGSTIDGYIYVVPTGRSAVVFDIDGTLTTGDDEIVEEVLLGGDPEMRLAADDVARLYNERGIQPVYITGRPVVLAEISRAWLAAKGFPAGPLFTVTQTTQSLPGESFVGAFKTDLLSELVVDVEMDIVAAYGNATTDICAYADTGVPSTATFILGSNGGGECGEGSTVGLGDDFVPHLADLQ